MHSPDNSTGNLLTVAEISAQAKVMQDLFRQQRERIVAAAGSTAHTVKDDNSPVTELDVEIERLVTRDFAQTFPGTPVYGEESGYDEETEGTFWLIDPIDGTKSFIQDIPGYTNMAVLIQNREAVACIIYDPRDDIMYTAQKNGGAYKNGQRLDLNKIPLSSVAYGRERLLTTINNILAPVSITCEAGPSGAGYGFGLVADGRIASRFNFPHLPGRGYIHDYAPGALLVLEAGGAIVSVEGDTYTYQTRSFVACHPALKELMQRSASQLRQAEIQTS